MCAILKKNMMIVNNDGMLERSPHVTCVRRTYGHMYGAQQRSVRIYGTGDERSYYGVQMSHTPGGRAVVSRRHERIVSVFHIVCVGQSSQLYLTKAKNDKIHVASARVSIDATELSCSVEKDGRRDGCF